jgi:hypothetical protein
MEPSTSRDQRRHSDDHHYKSRPYRPVEHHDSHDQHRNDGAAPERSSRRDEAARDSDHDRRPAFKKSKSATAPTKTEKPPPPKNLGALVLAVGLGFAAGFLISDGTRKTTGGKRRAPADPDSSRRPRSVSDGDDYWEQRQRLEYRRSSDRLALERRPSFVGRERSMSRSTRCVPEDEVEWDYWR